MGHRETSIDSSEFIQHNWVVITKLIPPTLPKGTISRAALIDQLAISVSTYPVTLVSAPAGYGKTTLVSNFYQVQEGFSLAWISLDDDDNDPVQFLVDIIAAFQLVAPDSLSTTQSLLISLKDPSTEIQRLMGVLINEILDLHSNPIVLILDDLHVINKTETLDTLKYLIAHLPGNLHLVFATRFDPPISLPRLRARGQIAEIRASNLRFSKEEVGEFLNQHLGLDLPLEVIRDLESQTGGWAAIVRLMAIPLGRITDQEDRAALIKNFSSVDGDVFEFIAEEVLDQQDPELRKFLLETSILSDLTVEICEAVTGQRNSDELLANLFRNSLVQIVGSEMNANESPIYRYHDLLAAFLHNQLKREYTNEEIIDLQCRAAEAQPGTSFSINHYLEAGKWEEASQTIQQVGQQLIFMGLYDTLNNWISALPANIVERHPGLGYLLGVAAFQRGEFENAQIIITQVLEKFEAIDDESNIGGSILILGAIASGFHDVERGRFLLNKALSYPLSPELQIMAHINRAWVSVYSNNWKEVESDVTTAMQLALKSEERSAFNALAPHLTAGLITMPNGVKRFKEYCKQVLTWFGDEVGIVQIGADSLIGPIQIMEGDIDSALQSLERARKSSEQLGGFVWLDVGIDFGILQHALIRAEYESFEEYWQQRLPHYEQVIGAREYLPIYMYMMGRVLCYQDRFKEAREIYNRLVEIKSPQDIPESQLARGLVAASLAIGEKDYSQAEGILRQISYLQQKAPHSVLYGSSTALLSGMYLDMDRADEALTELHKLIDEYERRNMLGLLLTERATIAPVLGLALEEGICVDQAKWLLEVLDNKDEFKPVLITSTGETLTQRELEILSLISRGMTNRDIAESLVVSESTVKSHTSSIFRKLEVRSRTQAAAKAQELKLF